MSNLEVKSMSKWLFQVRIKVSKNISEDLRGAQKQSLSISLKKIAENNQMALVCTYDAFSAYCAEAEENGINKYELYYWTKATIDNPEKKAKHLKSFAFYNGDDQVYEQHLALSLDASLQKLIGNSQLEEIKIIDSNPANNPQPPNRVK